MNAADKIHVLILAGTRPKGDPVAQAEGKSSKAFVEIDGRPMIDHVLQTIKSWPMVGDIILSMPKHEIESGQSMLLLDMYKKGQVKRVETGSTPCQSIMIGLEGRPTANAMLVTTADHPLLTHDILDEFVEKSWRNACDFTAAIAMTDTVENAYPDVKRTRVPLTDGAIGGCNLFMFKTPQAHNIASFWRGVENNRKKPLKMAMTIGGSVLVKYVLKKLSREDLRKTLEKKTGTEICLPLMDNPHAAIDVDKKEDLALVRQIFKEGYARKKRRA